MKQLHIVVRMIGQLAGMMVAVSGGMTILSVALIADPGWTGCGLAAVVIGAYAFTALDR